jgi:putative membrane-bound dehydrogenase-like protein
MIASEPLITDPVDMEIDEFGRLYVVEMHGYPLDTKTGSGNIILLSDEDGDGNMDKRTVFADGLTLPTSVMRWKKGIIVTDAPHVLYFEDTDNDGKSNLRDTFLSGFALSNPQHNVNTPVYGLDNWIYVAHEGSVTTREYKEDFGDEGSEIIFPGVPNSPKLPINANGRSIRFHPEQLKLEMSSSRTQFGHTFDEWGNLFGCNNSNQGYHEVIPNRYYERNPDLLSSEATQNMSDHLNAPEVFPTTINPDRQILTNVGVMTSACGITSYLGDSFPEPFNKNVTFISEPVSNLVHVDILKENGASFTSSRILENQEFLTSTDAWSRPVNTYVGPDGSIYVLDYYRRVIESPEWMSEEAIKAGNLYDGHDKGRIYRISPKEAKKAGRIYLGMLMGSSLVLFLPAIMITYHVAGTLDFISGGILSGKSTVAITSLLLFLYIFGIGKSALMPMHRWLPSAMIAPTPVSALLHAVAVVKAGVFTIVKVIIYIFGVDYLSELVSVNWYSGQWLIWIAAFSIIVASMLSVQQDN